ncbi:glycosyltransferase family 1 protein [Venatoribacter cucullus]|uniref:Glycosyltransferase family 1 protein n=1 Tax=Venatoribacter cucullus TaxID=2661630 RepID=A0A9X7V176_9GAMM|nr:glycosyltransferase [Venatoribacter cucullus]QQD23734.1 glycosyltransferase family 1 protein [Venatoribacter cucullus]
MKFIVYSAMNAETVVQNFGEPEYSYYFVLREFLPLLNKLGEVVTVQDPATEVDPLYQKAQAAGQNCVFLSFSPPHLTCLGLQCPTIPVFAWEFSTMPNEAWWADRPEHNWQWCLQQCAGAIVHSRQSADIVTQMMGPDFPVIDIPAPLWDRMENTRNRATMADNQPIELQRGIIFDSHDPDFTRWLPTEEDIIRAVAEARGQITVDLNRGFQRTPKSAKRITLEHIIAWYQQVLAPILPKWMRKTPDHWAQRANPWEPGHCQLTLSGVVFTSLFNPRDGRKNWLDMLTAFCHTFKDEPNATLVFKLGHRDHRQALHDVLMAFPRLEPYRCRVVLLHGFLDNNAYQSLLQQSHFTVNASYGEGQCLPLMEYLSCGKPAVAPCHSALADYINNDIAFVIDSWADATTWPHDPRVAYRTLRQQIDWTSLCKAYRDAYECFCADQQKYQQMSNAAIQQMQQHCSIDIAENRLNKLVQQIINETFPV